ncbi:MAG: DNA-directed RNA polymerase subunit omega [Ruminococcaceae bacterium]|nr:DNA-directed RNA polymerase subunit omega [Oscillospiraceae bacterium]
MIYPSIAELTKESGINRYTLVIAAAKSARVITDEYVRQREYAEKLALNKEADKNKNLATLIKKEYRDDKAVKLAVAGLYSGEFRILSEEEAKEASGAEATDGAAEAAADESAVEADAPVEE